MRQKAAKLQLAFLALHKWQAGAHAQVWHDVVTMEQSWSHPVPAGCSWSLPSAVQTSPVWEASSWLLHNSQAGISYLISGTQLPMQPTGLLGCGHMKPLHKPTVWDQQISGRCLRMQCCVPRQYLHPHPHLSLETQSQQSHFVSHTFYTQDCLLICTLIL